MKVLLTGATGYIGSSLAESLRQAGHQVIGLAHSNQGEEALQSRGFQVFRGDIRHPEPIAQAAQETDAVIHTAMVQGSEMPQIEKKFVGALLKELKGTGKTFIFTSGIWVLGNTGEKIADEDTPVNPSPITMGRPELEEQVLAAAPENIRSIVIRPSMVYGKGGGMIGMLLQSSRQQGYVRFIGDGENRWPLIHVEDLADLYLKALEQAPAGTSLIATGGLTMRVKEIAEVISQALEIPGKVVSWPVDQARQVMGPFADALVLDQQVSAAKAKKLLNWQPKTPSLIEELMLTASTN